MRSEVRLRRTLSVAAAALLLALPFSALPASKSKSKGKAAIAAGEVYRCRDERGQYVYGQSIPPVCMNQDVEVVDKTGRVVRVVQGPISMQEIEAQKAAEEAAKAAAQRDRTLLATYLSVADIERLRDQRLGLLEQQSRVTEQYIANLRERAARLATDAQKYRPYSDRPKAVPLPDHMAEEMVNTVNSLQVYEEELAKNTAERDRLRAEFDADIKRFKELKGIN
jgi:hypothetical protein